MSHLSGTLYKPRHTDDNNYKTDQCEGLLIYFNQ